MLPEWSKGNDLRSFVLLHAPVQTRHIGVYFAIRCVQILFVAALFNWVDDVDALCRMAHESDSKCPKNFIDFRDGPARPSAAAAGRPVNRRTRTDVEVRRHGD